jgi:hypothetical protein
VQVIAVDAGRRQLDAGILGNSQVRRQHVGPIPRATQPFLQQTAVLHARATLHHGAGPEWQCGLRADQQRAPRRV